MTQDHAEHICAIMDAFEDAEPDISTERLLAMTADSACCSVDAVIAALRTLNRLTPVK